jgi:hypothetical protein
MKTLIINANAKNLDQITPSLPNMTSTLTDWFQVITFVMIKKKVENFQVSESPTSITFQGVVENIKASNLEMRPEGQRKWAWISVFTTPELELEIDEVFRYQNKNYRVMTKNDWGVYGYLEYECMEDYTK